MAVLEAVVTARGNVQDVRIINSIHPDVDDAIVTALRQWKFRPATLHGQPIPVYFKLTVRSHPR